jgi:hypothetical protein
VGRLLTLVLVAFVGALAALAVADALRPEGEKGSAASPTESSPTRPLTLRETLRREEVTGFVLYSDRDCRLHALRLPQLVDDVIRDEGGADVFRCRFESIGGRIVSERKARAVRDLEVRDGQVLSDGRVVLTHTDLVRAARKHPNLVDYDRSLPLGIEVTDLIRLDGSHVVVALEITARYLEPQFVAAVFKGRRIDALAASFRGPYNGLFTDSVGSLVGAADGTVFTRSGRTIDPPRNLPAGRAVAFTPDSRFLVWLTESSIYLVGPQTASAEGRIIRIPKGARDLVWEPISSGTSNGPPRNR